VEKEKRKIKVIVNQLKKENFLKDAREDFLEKSRRKKLIYVRGSFAFSL
jgi:hypothetical protein